MRTTTLRTCLLALGLLLASGGHAADLFEEVAGVVDLRPPGQETWNRAEAGAPLPPVAEVRTGPNGYAVLRQGERVLELGRRSELALEGPDRLRIESGRLEVSQPASAPPLEVATRFTRATLAAGRANLRARGPGDRWTSVEGSLAVAPRAGGSPVEIPEGRYLRGDEAGLSPPQAISGDDMRRHHRHERRAQEDPEALRRQDLRWQDTLEKLLTASRRLVRTVEQDGVTPDDATFDQLADLGAALEAARDRIEADTEERSLGSRPASQSAAALAERAREAVQIHQDLTSRLERWKRPGPLGGRQATGPAPVESSPTGRPDTRVAEARIEEALRFLMRYQQALRRVLRVLGRLRTTPVAQLSPNVGATIQGRVLGGYRQAERLVLAARAEVQRVPHGERGPRTTQRLVVLNRQWNAVGVQFRRAQDLARQIRARVVGP